jgi:DNA-binding CsgD family transcriptional regulator
MDSLYRIIFAFLSKEADARKNLEKYLYAYIRPQFFEKIDWDSIFNPIVDQLKGQLSEDKFTLDRGLMMEDLVDMAMDDEKAQDIRALLKSHVKEKYGLSKEDAERIVHTGEKLRDGDEELIKKAVKDLAPLVYDYIRGALVGYSKTWKREKIKEPAVTEKTPEVETLPDHELIEDAKKEHAWEEGLIKDVLHMINQEKDEGIRNTYKMILKHRILAKSRKTQEDLAKEIGITPKSLFYHEQQLFSKLEKLLKPLKGMVYLDEKGFDLKVPDYKDYLKKPENSKDFKGYMKHGPRMSEGTKKVLDLLAEGKSVDEISTELKMNKSTVQDNKNDYFDDQYEKWIGDQVGQIKEACFRIRFALMRLGAVSMTPAEVKEMQELSKKFKKAPPVKEPEKKPFWDSEKKKEEEAPKDAPKKKDAPKEDEPAAVGVMKAHQNLVRDAIDRNRLVVTINFSADYDFWDLVHSRKDMGKEPLNFKFMDYSVGLKDSRSYGKKEYSIQYVYHQPLKEDGTFGGSGQSTLFLGDRSGGDELRAVLDKHVEDVIKKEGILPHRAPAIYFNKKTDKDYIGIKDFRSAFPEEFFEGGKEKKFMEITDPAHKKRVRDWVDLQQRKLVGPAKIPTSEKEEARELIHTLTRRLKEEKARPENVRDSKKIDQIEKEIKDTEDILKGKSRKTLQEVEDVLKEELLIRQAAFDYDRTPVKAFPLPEASDVKELVRILEKHKVTKPNPELWLTADDLRVLAKTLVALIHTSVTKDIEDMEKPGRKPEDKARWEEQAKGIREKASKELEEAEKGFMGFPGDLKKRVESLKSEKPEVYKELWKTKNFAWVNDQEGVASVKKKIKDIFSEGYKVEKPEHFKTVKMLDRTKFISLENYAEFLKGGIATFGKNLKDAALVPEAVNPKDKERLVGVKSRYEAKLVEMKKEIADIESKKDLTDEERSKISEIKNAVKEMSESITNIDRSLSKADAIPALEIAYSIKDFSSAFGKFYSEISSILWFKEKAIVRAADEEVPAGAAGLRDKISDQAVLIGATPIREKSTIDDGIKKLRTLLNRFIEMISVESRAAAGAEDTSWKEMRKRMLFPEDAMSKARSVITHLTDNPKKRGKGEAAHAELEKLINTVHDATLDGFTDDKIKAMADKEKISPQQAAVRLKVHHDALAKAALDKFILNWSKTESKKKERSPLGHRPAGEYDVMGKFVESHLPSLFELTPAPKEPEIPSSGIPTPKELRQRIERNFGRIRPDEVKEVYQEELDRWDLGGGGGGAKGRTRAKPVKVPPPSKTFEDIEGQVIHLLKEKPAKELVIRVLASAVVRVRGMIKDLKEGEFIDVEDVIDFMVDLLKNQLYNKITGLEVGPGKSIGLPPPGVDVSGVPDIQVTTADDARALFNKIVAVYEEINHYIEPDSIGMPPANLADARVKKGIFRKYLPGQGQYGLLDWYDHFRKEEEKGKKASGDDYPTEMAYNVCSKFAGVEGPGSYMESILR